MSEIQTSARVVPRFEKEADEADWWYEHRERVERELAAALESGGTAVRYKVAPEPTNILTLDAADERAARELAAKRGESYEAFVRRVVHEALELEESA